MEVIASRRGTLLAAVSAVVMGGGVTAGVAASAADLLPGEAADAVLLALCTHAEAADDRSIAVLDALGCDMPGSDPRWSAAYDESGRIFDECRASMNKAAEIPFQTAEGLRAKASLALREITCSNEDDLLLVRSVLRQIAGRA